MTPVGCAVSSPISGQLTLEGLPVLGLVDTGASVTCLGFSIWGCYHAQWGPLKPFEGTLHSAHGKPLQIAGKTQHLDLQWGEESGRACFIVIVGLESPPCLIGMDIMRPLRVRIEVTNGTATPAQLDPQTVHLNAAQQQRMEKSLPKATLPAAQPASPPPEIAPPAAPPAAPLVYLHHRRSRRHGLPLTSLAVLCCSKQQRYHRKRPVSSAATTRGPQRTSIFARRTLCRHL